MSHANDVEDLLDRLTSEYTDRVDRGETPDRRAYLDRAPASARPGLERCLKAIDAGSARASYRPLRSGVQLGRFEIVREIGRGGMALVFLARDPDLRRVVALKVLRPGLALERAHVDRFLREGHSMARLQHPGVVQVFEVGETDGYHWIAMEYVEGPSLATVIEALAGIEDGPPEVQHLVRAAASPQLVQCRSFEGACATLLGPAIDGLAAAHAAGLVHRDIKPSNVLIHRDGRAVLADFGLARANGDPALSLTGAPIGTPHYMAPEQAEAADHSVDARTDVYGFGAMLYELLGLRRPFEGENIMQLLDAIRDSSARPLRAVEPARSRDAEAVCAKAMEHDPDRRYSTADDLADDLACLIDGLPTAARKERGGALRRFFASFGGTPSVPPSEYKSPYSFLGLPLMHVVGGQPRPGRTLPWAIGWLAVGPRAVGAVAIGGVSLGAIALGGLSFGALALGGVAAGGVAAGGTASGLRTFGGLSVGNIAVGGIAVGQGAIGGIAIGRYAAGSTRFGRFKLNPWDGRPGGDEEVLGFFAGQPSPLGDVYRALLRIPGQAADRSVDEMENRAASAASATAVLGATAASTAIPGVIEGVVLDVASLGVADADVFLLDAATGYPMVAQGDVPIFPMVPGESRHGAFDWWVERTAADGRFRFEGVPVGSYRIVAQTAVRVPLGGRSAAVNWDEAADEIHLRGLAEDVRIQEGFGAEVTLEPLGRGVYHYDWKAGNDDVYLALSTRASLADPVLGFVGWRGPFLQGGLCFARMTSGSCMVRGLPAATLHAAVFANDNTPGFWFESVPLETALRVRSEERPVAAFSSGRQSPPARLQPLVDHLISLSRKGRAGFVHTAIIASLRERSAADASEPPDALRVDEMADYLDRVGPLDRMLDPEVSRLPGGAWTVGDLLAARGYAALSNP